jgi:hypothetical protein
MARPLCAAHFGVLVSIDAVVFNIVATASFVNRVAAGPRLTEPARGNNLSGVTAR